MKKKETAVLRAVIVGRRIGGGGCCWKWIDSCTKYTKVLSLGLLFSCLLQWYPSYMYTYLIQFRFSQLFLIIFVFHSFSSHFGVNSTCWCILSNFEEFSIETIGTWIWTKKKSSELLSCCVLFYFSCRRRKVKNVVEETEWGELRH